ncbi:MAG: type II secretion system protein [bacterium]
MHQKPHRTLRLSRPLLPLVSVIRITVALFIILGIGLAALLVYAAYDLFHHYGGSIELLPAAILLALIFGITGLFIVFRYRRIDLIVIPALFTLILCFGVLAIWEPGLGLGWGASLAVMLTLFVMLYRIPFLLFLLMTGLIVLGFFWIVIPILLSFVGFSGGNRGWFNIPPIMSNEFIAIGAILFAFAYFPRAVEWKRYVFPTWKPAFFINRKDDESGVTLIELLIGVAIVGIMTGSLVHVWATALRTQKEVELRAHVVEILNSQMDVLMARDALPAPSGEPQPLPIGMAEFVTPYRLTGHYLVEEAGEEGLVKITVRLQQDMDAPVPRHFRLVSYRRAGKEL